MSASLIDASEKPLRRSPTGMPGREEDWPVLHPQRSNSPGTLRGMMRETGSALKEQFMLPSEERYPRLGDISHQPLADQLPVSRFSARYHISQEDSTPDMRKVPNTDGDAIDPFQDADHVPNHNNGRQHKSIYLSHLSAGAAAVEKSASQSSLEPRQTRTSSLRARLSAGSIVKDTNSRVIGFTDFTAPSETIVGPDRRDSLRIRKEAPACSAAFSAAASLQTEASSESIGAICAPAKFVAGSRRPARPRRAGSRGSLRNEPRAPSPSATTGRPSRSAPEVLPTKDEISKDSKRPDLPLRRSSIPVASTTAQDSQAPAKAIDFDTENSTKAQNSIKQAAPDDFVIFEDGTDSNAAKNEYHRIAIHEQDEAAGITISTGKNRTSGLEAIDESPRHAYKFKRLSTKSPEYGPMLSISPSAERYIMGLDDEKENRPLNKKKSKELKQASKVGPVQEPRINGKLSSATKKRLERPLSSHGVPQPSARSGLVDPKAREKKARSADFNSKLETTATNLNAAKRLSNNPSVATNTSSSTVDPFYDASEELQDGGSSTPKAEKNTVPITQEDSPNSPLPQVSKSAEGTSSLTITATLSEAPKGIPKITAEHDPPKHDSAPDHRVLDQIEKVGPITPEQTPPSISARSGSYPPRSSSRMDKRDFNGASSGKLSDNPAAKVKGPPTPSKDFVRRQNNLGSARGHASSQLDLAKPSVKRDSVARDSSKSQISMPKSQSKSRFHFRTLFHKRSSDVNEPALSSKKAKSKVTINSNGSPFPPITEVHPIHRPTLASSNRSSAPTPRPSTTNSTSRPLTPATPIVTPTLSNEVSRTTTIAMSLLDSARKESSSPKKEKLLELGKIMVDVITQARDSEKAVEEAKLAVKRAEKASEGCKRAVGEVGRLVEAIRRSGCGV
ncbi:MAG: hypothetical protein Q9217_001731 [Psora testacea]